MDMIKVLVIDDEEVVCLAMQNELAREGYEADTTQNGEEAVEMAKKKKYDLAFIDYHMPGGMNGVETCGEIKKISPDTVCVFMTGTLQEKNTVERELAFIEAGGKVFFLYKPFLQGEIIEVAKKALVK